MSEPKLKSINNEKGEFLKKALYLMILCILLNIGHYFHLNDFIKTVNILTNEFNDVNLKGPINQEGIYRFKDNEKLKMITKRAGGMAKGFQLINPDFIINLSGRNSLDLEKYCKKVNIEKKGYFDGRRLRESRY